MARTDVGPEHVMRLSRDEFLADYWTYNTGEHVTILAPTGGGKTHLGYQLLSKTMTKERPALILVMKPRDATVRRFGEQLKLRTVRGWPPPQTGRWIHGKPRGWIVWPSHTFDPEVDDARQSVIFRRAILDSYKHGDRIVFADETYSLENELGLSKPLRTVWSKGRSMGCGLWAASQRPVYIDKLAYQAHHMFIGNDPDDDARRRLSEIGAAVDKQLVRRTVASLAKQEFVYVNRDDRTICIIGR